ncbi:MAG: TolB family protein, partial [Gemmatimonadales bacterium]
MIAVPTRRRISLLVAVLAAGACLPDGAGPAPLRGWLSLAPAFPPSPVAQVDFVRITLRRLGQTAGAVAPVVDTVLPFPAAADSLVVELAVPLAQPVETLTVTLALFDAVGDTTFRAGPYPVVVRAGDPGTPVAPPVRFSGPAAVVFSGDSVGISKGVFSVQDDGSGRLRLDSLGSAGDVTPRWSPDYRRVAFTYAIGAPQPNQLYVVAATGDTIATLVGDSSARRPRWSPDGKHLAFECGSGFSAQEDVCVIPDVTGPITALARIGDGPGKAFVTDFDTRKVDGPASFAWDPLNPDRLAVVRDTLLPPSQTPASLIYTVGFDGQNAVWLSLSVMALGTGPLRIVGPMDWSPDGAVLAFTATDSTLGRHLYLVNRDGTGLRRLTATPGDVDERPVFSPDGQQILFFRDRSCDADYWRIGRNGAGEVQVTDEHYCGLPREWFGHDWSPAGSDVVLVGSALSTYTVYK